MPKNTTPIRTVELFAGVGGFRVGLERSSERFETIWANQWEPSRKTQHAFDCYVHHFGDKPEHVNEDIALVKQSIPNHDLLVGGFPCQDYSVARTGAQGMQGKKGALWWQINDVLIDRTPPWVLLENVDRLLKSPSPQRGRDFAIILRCLSDLGYAAEWRVINAADYGQAQRRRRVFILAYHQSTATYQRLQDTVMPIVAPEDNDFAGAETILRASLLNQTFELAVDAETDANSDAAVNHKKNKKTHDNKEARYSIEVKDYQDLAEVSDHFQQIFYNFGMMINGQIFTKEVKPKVISPTILKSVMQTAAVDEQFYLTDRLDKWTYLKGAKRVERIKPNGEVYFYSEGGMSFPDDVLKPARTMLTSETSINRSSHVVSDLQTGRLRTLTPIEAERLNGFADDWTNTGMPTKFRFFAMGNALVVPIVTAIADTIKQHL